MVGRGGAGISSEFRAEEESGSGTWELRLRNITINKKKKEIDVLSKLTIIPKDSFIKEEKNYHSIYIDTLSHTNTHTLYRLWYFIIFVKFVFLLLYTLCTYICTF